MILSEGQELAAELLARGMAYSRFGNSWEKLDEKNHEQLMDDARFTIRVITPILADTPQGKSLEDRVRAIYGDIPMTSAGRLATGYDKEYVPKCGIPLSTERPKEKLADFCLTPDPTPFEVVGPDAAQLFEIAEQGIENLMLSAKLKVFPNKFDKGYAAGLEAASKVVGDARNLGSPEMFEDKTDREGTPNV